jgi:succinate-acetate transporter protein
VTSFRGTERTGTRPAQYPNGNSAGHTLEDAVYPDEDGHVGSRRFTGAYEPRTNDGVDTPAQTTDHRIADPAPLGLGAFALTTFVLSVFNAGILGEDLKVVVLPLALFYGGIAQMLAGMWEFRKGNTFGATAFTSFGAFWLAYAAYAKFVLPGIQDRPDAYKATGLFLLAWSIFAAMLFFAAIRISGALALVFATATAAFILLTVGEFTEKTSILHLGGIMGLVTAGCAWYTAWAGVLNDTWKRTVLPILEIKPRS